MINEQIVYKDKEELTFLHWGVDTSEGQGSYSVIFAMKINGSIIKITNIEDVAFKTPLNICTTYSVCHNSSK